MICERLLKEREDKIREEYDEILTTKLAGMLNKQKQHVKENNLSQVIHAEWLIVFSLKQSSMMLLSSSHMTNWCEGLENSLPAVSIFIIVKQLVAH